MSLADGSPAFQSDRFDRYGSEFFWQAGAFDNLAESTFNLNLLHFDNFFAESAAPRADNKQILNFRAMLPLSLSESWNFIAIPVVPIVSSGLFLDHSEMTDQDSEFGDTTFMALVSSPASRGDFVWGLGSVLTLPTATSDEYGDGKWQAGPAAAGFYLGGDWLFGVLSQHRWSLAADGEHSGAGQTTIIQYFFEYNLSDRVQIGLTHNILFSWNADGANSSAFPFDLEKARTLSIGKLPVKLTLDGFFEVNATWRF